jgi:hypothetical protein
MNEQNTGKSKQEEPFDLEKRLTAYFGPALRERPLPEAAWQNLRQRLGPQAETRRRRRLRRQFPRKRSQAIVPISIQEAFSRIIEQARVPATSAMLRCKVKPHLHEAAVRNSWVGRRKIQLLLPINALIMMGQDELDMLLATGLARSIGSRRPAYLLGRLLIASAVLIATLGVLIASLGLILPWKQHLTLAGFPFAIALCTSAAWFAHVQARRLAFRADMLTVRWLGRGHACGGLHALADRSRRPERRRWGEPSLAERIERVCGTRVEVRDNQLTLVG